LNSVRSACCERQRLPTPPLVFVPHDQIKWLELDFVVAAETAFDAKPIKKTCDAGLGYNPKLLALKAHTLRPLVREKAGSRSFKQRQDQCGEHRTA
jgi:hypothetical protein